MELAKFELLHYKSFLKSNELEFGSGANVVVGQNSSGKTALLEALSLQFDNKPHRSLATLRNPSDAIHEQSKALVSVSFRKDEVRALISRWKKIRVVQPNFGNLVSDPQATAAVYTRWLKDDKDVVLELTIPHRGMNITDVNYELYNSKLCLGLGRPLVNTNTQCLVTTLNEENGAFSPENSVWERAVDILPYKLVEHLRTSGIYRFKAERMNIGSCSAGNSTVLDSDASNLAEVLNVLSSRNPVRFERYVRYVKEVFPALHGITSAISHERANDVKVFAWFNDMELEREDLAIPLADCGTGFGQVLAILYVAITSSLSRILIIDEPQSFLHPGAARKLMEILTTDFSHHQYFISTHSPEVISASSPSTISILKFADCQSTVTELRDKDIESLKILFDEVGIKLSDVFGADNILWVEGKTEEICFPKIVNHFSRGKLRGTKVVAVKNTGDLTRKQADLVFDIYDRLSSGGTIMPPAIAFELDRENLRQEEMDELRRRARGKLYFLPARMYENYLLLPEAMTACANAITGFSPQPIGSEEVSLWLEKRIKESKYYDKNTVPQDPSADLILKVDGAKILHEFFNEFSDSRVTFSKVTHSANLTDWILNNRPEALRQVATFILKMLDSSL